VDEAEAACELSRPRTTLLLSRLARAGWIVRVAQGSYVALDPHWVLHARGVDPWTRYRGHEYFTALVVGVAGAVQLYGPRLRAIALFGSSTRPVSRPESDVDLMLVADPLPSTLSGRVAEVEPIYRDANRIALGEQARGGGYHVPQYVLLSPRDLAAEPPLLLDLTEDAHVLYELDGILTSALAVLRRRLGRHGARRIHPVNGPPYWVLHPGAKIGEVAEL
jgi:predicted nucleotidyltransferase